MHRIWIWAACGVLLCAATLQADQPSEDRHFRGNLAIGGKELLDFLAQRDILVSEEGPLSEDQRQRAERLLRQHYQDQGFPLADVSAQTSPSGTVFVIQEGPEAGLGQVSFEGNQAFAADELVQLLQLPSGKLDFDELESGLERLRQAYRDSGYPRAQARRTGLEVVETAEFSHFPIPFRRVSRHRIQLLLEIEEGARYTLGEIQQPDLLNLPELSAPQTGQVYSEARLLAYRDRIARHFADEGRLIRQFQVYQAIDDHLLEVRLDIRCDLYPRMDVGLIEFEGAANYPDRFYRREITFEEADPFDPREIDRSIQALNSTGVLARPLSEQDVELAIDDVRQVVDVRFQLTERKRQDIFYSLSRGDLGGVQLQVIYTIANLLGLGERLGVDVEQGGGVSGAAVGIASRYVLGTDLPVAFGLRFFRRQTGFKLSGADDKVRNLFLARRTGISGTASYRIRQQEEAGLRFTSERLSAPETTGHLVFEPFWNRVEESKDIWKEGLQLSNRFSFFSESFQSWNVRPSIDYRQVRQETLSDPKLTLRLQASKAFFSPGDQLLSERLFLDSDAIRGFPTTTSGPWGMDREGAVGPVGGDAFLTLNTEYEIPLKERLALAPFLDAGFNLSLKEPGGRRLLRGTDRVWRASIGGELRLRLPHPLPGARVVAAWNPLRLDRQVLTPEGLARLRDPKAMLRIAFDPVF